MGCLQCSPVQPCDGLQSALDIGPIHGCDVCKEGVVAVAVILRLLLLLDELSCWQAPARATLRLYIRATPTFHIYKAAARAQAPCTSTSIAR